MTTKILITYNQVHQICREAAKFIGTEIKPDLIVAIGGGGFIPARIIRTFLKGTREEGKNIPIQAIGLSLYEDMGLAVDEEMIGKEVVRTQWLDFTSIPAQMLIGKRILIVDEVDDTRTTLHYAVKELEKDVALYCKEHNVENKTEFSIFVVVNKEKDKRADLPEELMNGRYIAGRSLDDLWIVFPWETDDIEEHTQLANQQSWFRVES